MSRVASALPHAAPERAPRRAPAPPPDRHLRVVDPGARRRARRNHYLVRLGVVTVVGAVLVLVAIHVVMAEGQLRLESLTRRTTTAQQRYEDERLAHAEAMAPAAVVARATQLGLVRADGTRFLSVPGMTGTDASGGPSGVAGAPRAEDWQKVKPNLVAQP